MTVAGVLSSAERRALEALCRRMVPAAYDGTGYGVDLVAAVETRLATVDRARAPDVARALALFDHPLTALLLHGSLRRFSRAGPDTQEGRLQVWATSGMAFRRTVFQGLRRLVLSTYYALPGAQAEVGFRPLGERTAEVAWEGPAQGVSSDDEPILRVADPNAWRPPRPSTPLDAVDAIPVGITCGRHLGRDLALTADVCVVGTGAGGAVAAARLAEAGLEVVMLEAGGYWPHTSFTDDDGEMMARLYADQAARATDDLSVQMLQGECVGGSATINWMITLRTPPHVLKEWAGAHGTEGMRPHDMAPVFDALEHDIHARLVPNDAHSANNRIILDGGQALGWSVRRAMINAVGCVRAGTCGLGCRYGAKQSMLETFVPRTLTHGARLYADARVRRIEHRKVGNRTPLNRVHAVVRGGPAPLTLTVDAPIVVLAAGAVGTPVILLRSGLGGGGVGKFLRLHPTTALAGRYDEEIDASAGIPQSALCDEFMYGRNGYGFWIEGPAVSPALSATAVPGFGAAHRRVMAAFRHLGLLIVLTRDGALRNRSYGDVRVTRKGRVRIRYALPDEDLATMRRGIEAAARLHLAAGAEEVLTLHEPQLWMRGDADLPTIAARSAIPNRLGLFAAHVNGTCRIGTDPATSGCAPDGRLHGTRGIYVADGSLLPTAPGVNPQLTIMAVASVIADRILAAYQP